MDGPEQLRNLSDGARSRAEAVGHRAGAVARPVARLMLSPPLLDPRYQPRTWLSVLARRGERRRDELVQDISELLDIVVPAVAAAVLRRINLTEVVKRYVDLDSVVAEVDIEAVVDRLDLNEIVREHLDLDELVAGVDLDAAVARLDVDAVASRLDLDAVVDRLDIDAVIGRLDLVGIAENVIAEVDLPEIIRESTGSMASEAVRGVRMQGISGDEAVGRAIDRLRLRRGRPAGSAAEPGATRTTQGIPPQPEPGATTRS